MLILEKLIHGDTRAHLYGKDTHNILVAEIFCSPNCNHLLLNSKSKKALPLNIKQILSVLLVSNMINTVIDTTIDNVGFSTVWKHFPTVALFLVIYDDVNWVNIEIFPYLFLFGLHPLQLLQ